MHFPLLILLLTTMLYQQWTWNYLKWICGKHLSCLWENYYSDFSIPYLGALEEVNEAVKAVEESIRKLVSWVGSCLHFTLLLYLCLYWTFLFFWIKHFSSLAYQTILKDLKFSYSRCLIGKLSENHRAWKRFAWSWKSRATWKGKWLVIQNSDVYD